MGVFEFGKRRNRDLHSHSTETTLEDLRNQVFGLETKVAELKNQLLKQQKHSQELLNQQQRDTTDNLLHLLAQPLAYSVVQLDLLDQDRQIEDGELATTIRLFVEMFKKIGGRFIGDSNQIVIFNQELHKVSGDNITQVSTVQIKIPGIISPTGLIVRQALVVPSE